MVKLRTYQIVFKIPPNQIAKIIHFVNPLDVYIMSTHMVDVVKVGVVDNQRPKLCSASRKSFAIN